jgi:hypothetical protein
MAMCGVFVITSSAMVMDPWCCVSFVAIQWFFVVAQNLVVRTFFCLGELCTECAGAKVLGGYCP